LREVVVFASLLASLAPLRRPRLRRDGSGELHSLARYQGAKGDKLTKDHGTNARKTAMDDLKTKFSVTV
jgi:hypothetical protein